MLFIIFHCWLRQHAFATADQFPLKLQQVLTAEGLDVDKLTADISHHASASEQAPPTVARLMKDAHCNTWFTCRVLRSASRPQEAQGQGLQ